GVLLDVHPRKPSAAGAQGTEASRMDERQRAGEVSAGGGSQLRLCTLGAQGPDNGTGGVQTRSRKEADGTRNRAARDHLLQGLQEPTSHNRSGDRNSCA